MMADGVRGSSEPIDINQLAVSLQNTISNDAFMSPNSCIFKTPKILYRHNQRAYVPNAFSIGPYHHSNPDLKPTEKIKYKYLNGLISRAQNPQERLLDLMEAIALIEPEARSCYAAPVIYKPDEFVKMLVVDGCFLIELFRKDFCEEHQNDPLFTMPCMRQYLSHDLVLLENQVPWFVLECLFDKTKDDQNMKPLDLCFLPIFFFPGMLPFDRSRESTAYDTICSFIGYMKRHKCNHILDLIRHWYIHPFEKSSLNTEWTPFPSATTLLEAGIKFKKKASNCMLDITFSDDGHLEIPPLIMEETSETRLRNLISFEQCSSDGRPIITSYAILLDNLVNTTHDLDILCKDQIITNWLDPEDATQILNKLYVDTYLEMFYYNDLCAKVKRYCERRWPRWRAAYLHNYFGTPWAIVSQVVAAILLILTFLQTLFSII